MHRVGKPRTCEVWGLLFLSYIKLSSETKALPPTKTTKDLFVHVPFYLLLISGPKFHICCLFSLVFFPMDLYLQVVLCFVLFCFGCIFRWYQGQTQGLVLLWSCSLPLCRTPSVNAPCCPYCLSCSPAPLLI